MGRVLLAATACAAPSVTTDPIPATTSTVEQSADRVGTALSEVSLQRSAQMTDDEEDLILAWSDFERDVRFVANLIRKPSQVEIEGMQRRVEAFEEILDDSVLDLPAAEWEEFTSAFQTLIEPKDSA